MSIFKCKMCGGTLEISEHQTVAECEYCGTQQTLPRLNDERKANLYDRANHFRRNNEFDKAMSIYESILNEDNTDAEAYWSLVLCRYGIEYVEDPATHKRVPTVNRAQFTSIFDDDNYKSALSNADMSQRAIYEAEARAINEIQKGILAISQKEEPFDVFICYKETDNNGRRTPDSVLANDLYHQLTQEGFKVFFSRITLEDKLGTAYEPYIFAALNSAKVMVVLGTRPEYFKAVWVKNEWSRYLSLVKQSGGKKVLIPAYKDMDPYDLPEEFSHLQAQDMGKLGFMQDLIRGIKKLTQAEAPKVTVKETVIASGSANVAPLLKRAFMYLEDGDWKSADEYCERVLDQDPENAEAYLGKLMAELKCRKQEQLKDQAEPFDGKGTYSKAIRFGSSQLKATLESYNTHIRNRNENARLEKLYNNAVYQKNNATTEKAYLKAAEMFAQISTFKDARLLADECRELAKETEYQRALRLAAEGTEKAYHSAASVFSHICGYKDADSQAKWCVEQAEVAHIEMQFNLARNLEIDGDKFAGEKDFSRAIDHLERAIAEYSAIPEREETTQRIAECEAKISNAKLDIQYFAAKACESSIYKQKMSHEQKVSELNKAIAIYQEIGQWKDSRDRIQSCKSQIDELEAQKQKELEEAEQLRLQMEKDAKARATKIKIICIIVAILVVLAAAVTLMLYLRSPESMYTYSQNADGTVTITKLKADSRAIKDGVLTLPDSLNGHTVTGVAMDAFSTDKAHTLVIPATITHLSANSLSGLSGLKSVTFGVDATTCLSRIAIENLTSYTVTHSGSCAWSEWIYEDNFDCSQGGNQYRTCKVCARLETQAVAAGTHTISVALGKAATCTEDGFTDEESCTTCNWIVVASETIPAFGHTPVTDEAVEATCAQTGLTEGEHCSICNATLTAQSVIDKLPHSYSEWTLITSATCEKNGLEEKRCTICDAAETRTLDAIGHNYGEWKVTKSATCSGNGVESKICSNCGDAESRDISALGHNYGEWKTTVAASCTKEGTQEKKCSRCGATEKKSIDALGHLYSNGICTRCYSLKPSDGLEYTLSSDGTYSVSYGSCTDTNVVIPSMYNGISVTAIASSGFADRSNIVSISLPESIETIGQKAFMNCSALSSITIPDAVTILHASTFYGCTSLASIVIPKNVSSIEISVFNGCSNLTSVYIPTSVTSIASLAFSRCERLAKLQYGGTIEQWKKVSLGDNLWGFASGKYTVSCTDGEIEKYK